MKMWISGLAVLTMMLVLPADKAAAADATWLAAGNMNYARVGHTATLLPDGRVLVLGGTGGRARA